MIELCNIIPNLSMAEYYYRLLLMISLFIVIYCLLNLYLTAFRDRVPKFLNYTHMHFVTPFTYGLGAILYFTLSQAFTLQKFIPGPGFFIMIAIVFISLGSAVYNKLVVAKIKRDEEVPLLS